jgi:hypothetical protein
MDLEVVVPCVIARMKQRDNLPHLKLVRVAQTNISVYQSLLMEGVTL